MEVKLNIASKVESNSTSVFAVVKLTLPICNNNWLSSEISPNFFKILIKLKLWQITIRCFKDLSSGVSSHHLHLIHMY